MFLGVFFMLNVNLARKMEPELELLADEEVLAVIKQMYDFAELSYDVWKAEKDDSKNPTRVIAPND